MIHLTLFLTSLLCCSILTFVVRNTARKYKWLGRSTSSRDVHVTPVPRLGGVAIFVSLLLVLGIFWFSGLLDSFHFGADSSRIRYILGAGALVFALGLYDDIRGVGPHVKIAVQAIAALILFSGGIKVAFLPIAWGYTPLGLSASLAFTVLWVVWVTNAFNLIDGIDGLAAGSALFSTLVVFIVSLLSNNHLVSVLTAILAGTVLGVLRYNFSPATIFLGDCGSLFVGFMLSAVALAGAQKGPTAVAVAIPIVSFGLPILDTVLAVARRFLSGHNVFHADRQHIHHKLLERGLTQRQVVIVLYGVSAFLALLSLLLLYPSGSAVGVVLAVLGVGIWIGVQHLGYAEFVELGRAANRTLEQKSAIASSVALRHIASDLGRTRNLPEICRVLETGFAMHQFDSFELLLPAAAIGHLDTPLECSGTVGRFAWSRNTLAPRFAKARWELTLDLASPDFSVRGQFVLRRSIFDKPGTVDVDLLVSEFHAALAEALGRAIRIDMPALTAHIPTSSQVASAGLS